jgi:aryl-alcohol dehydrogenase-like predicted oxidoreductase
VRQQPGITSTIIGAKNVDQLNDNIRSAEVVLSGDQLAKIDAVSALEPAYPGWMTVYQSRDRMGVAKQA